MPRRPDYHEAFWIDPNPSNLAGYPETMQQEEKTPDLPRRAIVAMRDRIGFRYERQVGPGDDVSPAEAAQLLMCSEMTVHRWLKGGKLPRKKRKGYWVVGVDDLVRFAQTRGRSVPKKKRLRILYGPDRYEDKWIPTNWEAASDEERRQMLQMMTKQSADGEVNTDVPPDKEGTGGAVGGDALEAGRGARAPVRRARVRGR